MKLCCSYFDDRFWVGVNHADQLDGVALGSVDEHFLDFNLGLELDIDLDLFFHLYGRRNLKFYD